MYSLRLYHDRYEATVRTASDLYAQHGIWYTREGLIAINGAELKKGKAIYIKAPASASAGPRGAFVWRWELVRSDSPLNLAMGEGVDSHLIMGRRVTMFELYPKQKWLFKLDSIINHEGTTGLHSHPGSGIRCMLDGQFKIESNIGECFYDLNNDDAWYEEGAYPLVSTAPDGVKTTFLRGMILPVEYDKYPDTALWIEGEKKSPSTWKLYSQQEVTLI